MEHCILTIMKWWHKNSELLHNMKSFLFKFDVGLLWFFEPILNVFQYKDLNLLFYYTEKVLEGTNYVGYLELILIIIINLVTINTSLHFPTTRLVRFYNLCKYRY